VQSLTLSAAASTDPAKKLNTPFVFIMKMECDIFKDIFQIIKIFLW
jgi:hypothetical protein